ncbi:MAG: tRNA epoxyqueuosine(34) reductase QueG [Isosphaeraceae bacterium]
MSAHELTERLKSEAVRLGFDQVGIAPAVSAPGYLEFLKWLEKGHSGGMDYLRRQEPNRSNPANLLEGVRSIVVLSVVYGSHEAGRGAKQTGPAQGQVARYAMGCDYHRVLWDKLELLLEWLKGERPDARGRAVADTAPLLERDYARLAGIGWIGKNTMLISRKFGSFTFLGALLTDVELAYDDPHRANHCGNCTRCLDACPTGAFPAPYQLDSRRCISYWTIEHRGMLPDQDAENLDGWVFGCDICQDVCPWNRKAPSGRLEEFQPRAEWVAPDLIAWLNDSESTWQTRLKGSALKRTKRVGLLRNAALVLGTRRRPEAIAALASRLDDTGEDPIVRASSAWALGRIGGEESINALERHLDDPDPIVCQSVREAHQTGQGSRCDAGWDESLESPDPHRHPRRSAP